MIDPGWAYVRETPDRDSELRLLTDQLDLVTKTDPEGVCVALLVFAVVDHDLNDGFYSICESFPKEKCKGSAENGP